MKARMKDWVHVNGPHTLFSIPFNLKNKNKNKNHNPTRGNFVVMAGS